MHHIEAGSFFINYILILERGVDFPEDLPEAELERFGELFETDIGAAGRLAGKWFARMGEPRHDRKQSSMRWRFMPAYRRQGLR